MTREQAENLLSELRTRETAADLDMVDEWDKAWYLTSMADYDDTVLAAARR